MELSCSRFCSIANSWKGLSPVAVSFRLRKFKCRIAEKKKMKVKTIAEMNIKHNKKLYLLGRIDWKFKRY